MPMKTARAINPFASRPARRARARFAAAGRRGFTLIELLVVISIIGVLAGLVVGLSSTATRKGKESRMRAELSRLVTAIENYKAKFGHYPPDNPGRPGVNQLFYELSGTRFDQPYFVADHTRLHADEISKIFGTDGFSNSARGEKNIRFTTSFKPSQRKEVRDDKEGIDFEVLVTPVAPRNADEIRWLPRIFTKNSSPIRTKDGSVVNPWLYDSSSLTRNNPDSFDLWAEIVIGKHLVRFSNWETAPVVVRDIK